MDNGKNHGDCRNFIAADVAKGFCNFHKARVGLDGQTCPGFVQAAKCKVCSRYESRDEQGMGRCSGFEDEAWAYGEMKAINCEMFRP